MHFLRMLPWAIYLHCSTTDWSKAGQVNRVLSKVIVQAVRDKTIKIHKTWDDEYKLTFVHNDMEMFVHVGRRGTVLEITVNENRVSVPSCCITLSCLGLLAYTAKQIPKKEKINELDALNEILFGKKK